MLRKEELTLGTPQGWALTGLGYLFAAVQVWLEGADSDIWT